MRLIRLESDFDPTYLSAVLFLSTILFGYPFTAQFGSNWRYKTPSVYTCMVETYQTSRIEYFVVLVKSSDQIGSHVTPTR